MPGTGFIEISSGDITLAKRLVAIARWWSDRRDIVLWVRGIDRQWVDLLLSEADPSGSSNGRLRILDAEDEATALAEARQATSWVVSSPTLIERFGAQQVGVYWPSTAFSFGSLEWPPEEAGQPGRPMLAATRG